MRKSIRKHYRVFKELVKLRFHRLTVFRLDFFAPFFVDGSLFLAQLLVFGAVYANVDSIGTWGRAEMILYIGTFSLLNAVSMTVCFFGLTGIPGKIVNGEMDMYLSQPISPLFRLTFEKINPGSIPLILMSLCLIGWGVRTGETAVGWSQVGAYVFWVCVMEILYYDMEVLMRAVSFYMVSNARLVQLESACLDLCMKLPGIAFYGVYKFVFYYLLPYGIMATLPVQSLIGELMGREALGGIGVVTVFTGFTCFVWTKGIKRYNSASS